MPIIAEIPNSIFLAIIVIIGVEYYVSVNWNAVYYSNGIQIYRKKFQLPHVDLIAEPDKSLADLLKSNRSLFLGNEIGTDIYALRRKFSVIKYSPTMHCKMEICRSSSKIQIKGYLNYYVLSFSVLFVFMFGPPILFFIFAIVGIGYYMEKKNLDDLGHLFVGKLMDKGNGVKS